MIDSRAEQPKPATAAVPVPQLQARARAPRGQKGHPRRRPPSAAVLGRFVDVDMGIGRHHGYRDPRRLGGIRVRPHLAIPPAGRPVAVGRAMFGLRLAAGATQRAVGRLLGVSGEAVSRWEWGLVAAPSHVRALWVDVCRRAAHPEGQ
jgi:hypothetical protein